MVLRVGVANIEKKYMYMLNIFICTSIYVRAYT